MRHITSPSPTRNWVVRAFVCAAFFALRSSLWAACGPGPHWVANCATGTDTVTVNATIGTSTGINLSLSGQVRIFRGTPSGTTIPIEIVSMNLSGSALGGVTLTAGDGNGNLS